MIIVIPAGFLLLMEMTRRYRLPMPKPDHEIPLYQRKHGWLFTKIHLVYQDEFRLLNGYRNTWIPANYAQDLRIAKGDITGVKTVWGLFYNRHRISYETTNGTDSVVLCPPDPKAFLEALYHETPEEKKHRRESLL